MKLTARRREDQIVSDMADSDPPGPRPVAFSSIFVIINHYHNFNITINFINIIIIFIIIIL